MIRWVTAGVLSLAAVVVGWRVLAPAELLATASSPYPDPVFTSPSVTGRTNVAPLIVDDRIRVYAAKRQVRADAPVGAESVNTPRWSFRRWPQQLSGVAAVGTTVVSRWSDGELVALDGRTGEITWRVEGPPAPSYTGHRTGASTVWAPPGMHTADGVVLVFQGRWLSAYEASTGTRRWQVVLPPGCANGFTTAGGEFACTTGAVDLTNGSAAGGWPAGPYTPIACDVAASRCAGLRDGSGRGWLTTGARPIRAAALDAPAGTAAASPGVAAPGPVGGTPGVAASGPVGGGPGVAAPGPVGGSPGVAAPGPVGGSPGVVAPGPVGGSPGVAAPGPVGGSPGVTATETIAAGLVVAATGAAVVATTPAGARRWTTAGTGQILGATADAILLLTPDRTLVVLDAVTGARRASFPLRVRTESLTWNPGLYQITGHYVAIERLHPGGPADPDKPDHYYALDTDIVAAIQDMS